MNFDLLVNKAVLPDGTVVNIGCAGGKITAVGRDVTGDAQAWYLRLVASWFRRHLWIRIFIWTRPFHWGGHG